MILSRLEEEQSPFPHPVSGALKSATDS
jgi:hypothetical protein